MSSWPMFRPASTASPTNLFALEINRVGWSNGCLTHKQQDSTLNSFFIMTEADTSAGLVVAVHRSS